ncbi:peptidase family protein c78 [Babesia ovis]|uniref:Peptidase family protein c78 n=1 Tax=Babesia ovis TaxID=5869 RepID=A0A9W5TB51_BABOV|nr:peptidase family protein c78 [Babesia ovis]
MTIQLSLSLFNGLQSGELESHVKPCARLLCRFKDGNPEQEWICSYRVLDNGSRDSSWTLPNYLELCGILLVGEHQESNLLDAIPLIVRKRIYHMFKWIPSTDQGTLQESLQYFKVNHNGDNPEIKQTPITEIVWVENNLEEVKRRGYSMIATTFMARIPLDVNGELEVTREILGLKSVDQLPPALQTAVCEYLQKDINHVLRIGNEDLSMELHDIKHNALNDPLETGYAHLGFGSHQGCQKHALIYMNEPPSTSNTVHINALWQTSCIVPIEHVSESPSNELADGVLEALRHLTQQMFDDDNKLMVYVARGDKQVDGDTEPVPNTRGQQKNKVNPKAKGKSNTQLIKKPDVKKQNDTNSNLVDILNNAGPFEIGLSGYKRMFYLSVTLDRSSGDVAVQSVGIAEDSSPVDSIAIHMITKCYMDSATAEGSVIPFGGVNLMLFDLLSNQKPAKQCVSIAHPMVHLKLLIGMKSLVDLSIPISPHFNKSMFPQWISNKTARATLVKGPYQYYHYNQCGKNDSGWGCCYRSIQMVASWYLMQYRTLRPVPTHDEIQTYIKERDPSHAGLVVGSTTWIGTVEAGYFINWYLNYDTKTFYLSDVTEFRNYNGLIAKHFATVGSPIIMGAGMFAYVIVGICIGATANDVAYLIADPHYVGEDNVKQIQTKGAVGWKKIDFIAKAANGGFINLCCPLFDQYENHTAN